MGGLFKIDCLMSNFVLVMCVCVQVLVSSLDAEGRYYVLNAIANQLRYPNNHTHYFSCVLLYLFLQAKQSVIKEQITRYLLFLLVPCFVSTVHKPFHNIHPISYQLSTSNKQGPSGAADRAPSPPLGPPHHLHRAHQEPPLQVLGAALHPLRPRN